MRLLIAMTLQQGPREGPQAVRGKARGFEPVADDPDPVDLLINRDFLAEFRGRLSEEELALWDRRNDQTTPGRLSLPSLCAPPRRYASSIHEPSTASHGNWAWRRSHD